MRIATWNVNSLKARQPRVEEWLEYAQPDVLCLQETKLADDAFPHLRVLGARLRLGAPRPRPVERRRHPVARRHRRRHDRLRRPSSSTRTRATHGCSRPRAAASASSASTCPTAARSAPSSTTASSCGSTRLHDWLAGDRVARSTTLAVLGDFNVAPEDRDVWSPKAFEGATHVTEPERAAVAALCELGHGRRVPAPLRRRPPLHLLGLPPRRLPPAPRHAHRPRARDRSRSPSASRGRSSTATPARASSRPTTRR